MDILNGALSIFGSMQNGLLGYAQSVMKEGFQNVIRFHKEGIAFARDMGMSARQAQAYTDVLIQRTQVLANKYGVSADAIKQVQRGLSEATGKQLMLNNSQAEGFVQIDKLMGAQSRARFTEEIMNGMGGQIDTVQSAMAKVYATAAKQGLTAKKLTDKVAQNLSMANRLSFRNGIDGITRMAALSEKLGFNMSSVESAANKFLDLDKAITSSAQMQMLGGSAAAMFGNPLTAAFEANYDPESFAQRMTDSLASYATFDASKGIAKINGMNMDFVRSIGENLGIGAEEAAKIAKKQAEVRYKENNFSGVLNRVAGGDEAKRNFILNNSQIDTKTGKLQVQGKNIDEISEKDWKDMMSFEGMSDKEILERQALTLTSIDEQIVGASDSVSAAFAKGIDNYLPGIRDQIQKMGTYLQGFTEQWGGSTGKVIGKAMNWIISHGGEIKTVANTLLSFVSKIFHFVSEYTKTAITLFVGWKLGKWLLVNSLTGGVAKKAVRSVARGAVAGGKGILRGAKAVGTAVKSFGASALGGIKATTNYWKEGWRQSANQGLNPYRRLKSTFANPYQTASGQWRRAFGYGSRITASAPAKAIIRTTKALKIGAGLGLGIGGALANSAMDKAVESGKIKRGGAAHYAGKMASTAAEYAALGGTIGSIIPVLGTGVGTALGGAVGAIKGAYDTWKSLPENADKGFMDYTKACVKGIMNGGKEFLVSASTTMIKYQGKFRGFLIDKRNDFINAIKEKGEQFKNVLMSIGKILNQPIEYIKAVWNGIKNWWNSKNKSDSVATPKASAKESNTSDTTATSKVASSVPPIKKPHDNGGFITSGAIGHEYPIDKNGNSAKFGEVILNPTQQRNFMAMANDASYVRAKEYGGERVYVHRGSETSNINGNSVTVKDFKINLGGTLKLDAGNNSKDIDMNSLLNNYQFLNSLKEMIKDSINTDMNGGRYMNDLATRRGQVSSSSIIGR